MLNALHTASTGMEAQQQQIDTISNNLANINTTGFKKSRSEFQDLLYQNVMAPGAPTSTSTKNPTGIQKGVGVRMVSSQKLFTKGAVKSTGRAFDLAIDGHGFFPIQQPNGEIVYTRDGSFKTDDQGRIVTAMGYPIYPELKLPNGTQQFNVSQDGLVSVNLNPTENI